MFEANSDDKAARSCVNILGESGETYNYWGSHRGNVKCLNEENGQAYYVDHLPHLGNTAQSLYLLSYRLVV